MKTEINYIDRNSIKGNNINEINKLINNHVPYKEMTEEQIEDVIMYHAENIAKQLFYIWKKEELEKIQNKHFKKNDNIIKSMNEEFLNCCKQIKKNTELQKKRLNNE